MGIPPVTSPPLPPTSPPLPPACPPPTLLTPPPKPPASPAQTCYRLTRSAYSGTHIATTSVYLPTPGLTKSDFAATCYPNSYTGTYWNANGVTFGPSGCGAYGVSKYYMWHTPADSSSADLTFVVAGTCCNGAQHLTVSAC